MSAEKDKYGIFWKIGTYLCLVLYFSGIVWLYTFFRKCVFGSYRSILLTFHRIEDNSDEPEISVSPHNFKRQMEYLSRKFNVTSLVKLLDASAKDRNYSKDFVAITFDDGYKDNFRNALPVLNKYNFPATIFLVSSMIGEPKMLSVDEIKIMQKRNISFGSHSVSHPVLSEIDIAKTNREIIDSKRILEGLLEEEVKFFAYPKGEKRSFKEQIKRSIQEAGYRAAFTTENGAANKGSDLFGLPRIGIRDCPLFVFKTRVSGILESRLFYFVRKVVGLL